MLNTPTLEIEDVAEGGDVKNKKQARTGMDVVRSWVWWRRRPAVVVGTICSKFW